MSLEALSLVLFLVSPPASPSPTFDPTAKWPEFTSPDGSFALRLPGVPVRGPDGYVVSQGDDLRYWANELRVPEKLRTRAPEDVLAAFVPVGSSPYGPDFVPTLKESVPGKVQGLPAVYVHVEGHAKGRPEYSMSLCVIHRGSTLLAIGYAARTDLFQPWLFKRLLASVKLLRAP